MALTPLTPHQQGSVQVQPSLDLAWTSSRARTPYSDWYHSQSDESWAQPAERAYRMAIQFLEKELSPDEFRSITQSRHNSMLDVQSAVQIALKDYETRAKASKARMWLSSCSSRVKYYETVFDTLAQHYPEFTSLAWGTFKFLFTAVLNHEELLTEISKAISRIADLLPRTELHSALYPTERMRETVARLYAKIIDFALKAVQWFKKSKFKHSVAAVFDPLKLSFGPVIDEIRELSRRVDELANAASKAEIRDQHVKINSLEWRVGRLLDNVDEMRADLRDQKQFFEKIIERVAHQSLNNEILADFRDQRQFLCSSQLEDVHQLMLQQGTPDSESSLAFCRSTRTRRVQKVATQLPAASIPALKSWVDEPTSSLLLAQSRGVRTSPLDFAVEFLNAVLERGSPIIWALPSLVDSSSRWSGDGGAGATSLSGPQSALSVAGILRSLVLQTLQLSAAAMTETRNPVNIRHLRGASTIEQWFQILERCISTLPALFIIVDLGVLEEATSMRDGDYADHDDEEDDVQDDRDNFRVSDFIDRMSEMAARHHRPACLKVVIAAVSFREATSMDADEVFGDSRITTDRGRQISRLMRQPKYRGVFRQRNKKISEEIRVAVGITKNRGKDDEK